ncbi:hypothetical protein TNCV_4787851 [Trichonephila clavipes]|nr:hypothetical protein TNCV_4787851 [Trichonephila clavipes]
MRMSITTFGDKCHARLRTSSRLCDGYDISNNAIVVVFRSTLFRIFGFQFGIRLHIVANNIFTFDPTDVQGVIIKVSDCQALGVTLDVKEWEWNRDDLSDAGGTLFHSSI